jgi:hypothetical protein
MPSACLKKPERPTREGVACLGLSSRMFMALTYLSHRIAKPQVRNRLLAFDIVRTCQPINNTPPSGSFSMLYRFIQP